MAVLSDAFHVPLGTPLPDVTLPSTRGGLVDVREYGRRGPLLVFFSCNHCPYVRHVEAALAELTARFADELCVLAISSNDIDQYPDDDVAGLESQLTRANWNFPYLIDADQSAAKTFNAACTPDFFLYDADASLVYRGAFDASTPKNGVPLTGDLLEGAITDTLANRRVAEPQRPAMGCGIKWKPGNEPQPFT